MAESIFHFDLGLAMIDVKFDEDRGRMTSMYFRDRTLLWSNWRTDDLITFDHVSRWGGRDGGI